MKMKSKPVMWGILILTHGRPDNVKTTAVLRRCGYTGPIKYVIDNEDKRADEYYANFPDDVIMFDKEAIARQIDESDNFNDRRTITYARNAAYDIAKDLGWSHFIQMDDDYTSFVWKFDDDFKYKQKPIRNLQGLFQSMIDFMVETQADTIALAQGGDYIGGDLSAIARTINICLKFKRKSMNTFVCAVDKPIKFISRMNEDVSTYTSLGSIGRLFFTFNIGIVNQTETQSNPGGITELYQKYGTYVKSFYTVMRMPSCVKVTAMNTSNPRLHHEVSWRNCVPAILDQKWRKTNGR
jgi:hypothetical protein